MRNKTAGKTLKQWRKERDEVVRSLDVQKLKAFYIKWALAGVYDLHRLPPDNIVEISMYKMACEITSMPDDVKQKAAAWLTEHGYSIGIT